MEIRYICDNALEARLSDLTYNDLREMLPHVKRVELLSLQKLIPVFQPLLSVYEGDIAITVYRNGVYLYTEAASETVYSVSLAGQLMNFGYTSVEEMDLIEERKELFRCQWYWPLVIAGQFRLVSNGDKRQAKIAKRLAKYAAVDADEAAGDPGVISVNQMERQDQMMRLSAAWKTLSQKEQDSVYLSLKEVDTAAGTKCLTQAEIGRMLGLPQTTVSDAIKRGIGHLREKMLNANT